MSNLEQTPSGERIHIAFFGRRNVGKSSLVNAFTGQCMSIVADVKGTTTDPVSKAMELLPLGPVQIVDTPGIDDEGTLGELRVRRTRQVLRKTDIAIVVTDGTMGSVERALLALIEEKKLPCVIAHNKADLLEAVPAGEENILYVSAKTGLHIRELREIVAAMTVREPAGRPLVADLLDPGDVVLLVVPIDKAAPKGRLILPQQQTIRDILEAGASAVVCRDTELADALGRLTMPPRMVITDSQVFDTVSQTVPESVPLTSFSILMARYKGSLTQATIGAFSVDSLEDGDRVLISEGCTHHRQCNDIGTVKLPAWIEKYTGKKLEFSFTSGGDFPEDLDDCKLVVHCGGCMLSAREMCYRQSHCQDRNVPVTNYGILIAHLNGILKRATALFINTTPAS